MRRREFITLIGGAAAIWPFAARGQGTNATKYVAWLGLGHAGTPSPYLEALRTGLRELGWSEGRNLKIVAFWATGREDMEGVAREVLKSDPDVVVTQELMAIAMRNLQSPKPVVFGFSGDPVDGKLVESWARPGTNFTGMKANGVDVIVAAGFPTTLACKVANVPTVVFFGVGDPVATRLIDSLARPGGNITGISDNAAALATKRFELIKQAVPKVRRVEPERSRHEHAL